MNEWIQCESCAGDGIWGHECGEDTCCCLYPEENVPCAICNGAGGWNKRPPPTPTELLLENARLREALQDLFRLMDEGWLVRNTDDDQLPNFAFRSVGPVLRLKSAHDAIAQSHDHSARGAEAIRKLRDAAKPYARDCGCAAGCNRCALLNQALKEIEDWEAGK